MPSDSKYEYCKFVYELFSVYEKVPSDPHHAGFFFKHFTAPPHVFWFSKNIDNLICKTKYKIHASQHRKFLTVEKAKILGNAFISSQFNYSPLIWMLCRKTFYSKKILKVIYGIDDFCTTFYYAAAMSQFSKGTLNS